MTSRIDEEVIAAAFTHFEAERTRTGAERDAFTQQLRAVVRAHLLSLVRTLEQVEVYLTAYTTGFEPPGGQQRAQVLKRALTDVLAPFRHPGDTQETPRRHPMTLADLQRTAWQIAEAKGHHEGLRLG